MALIACAMMTTSGCGSNTEYVKCEALYTIQETDTIDKIAWRGWKLDRREIEYKQYRYELWVEHNSIATDNRTIRPGDTIRLVWYEVKK